MKTKMDVVYFRFKSAKDFRPIPIDGPSISASELKVKIALSSYYGRGKDFDLLMYDSITGDDINESTIIASGSSVLIGRIPGWHQKSIVLYKKMDEEKVQEAEEVPTVEEPDFHDFGPDVLDCKKDLQSHPETQPINKQDEDEKIRLLVNTPSLKGYNCIDYASAPAAGPRKSYKLRGHGCLVLEPKIPPPGYVCHRCNEPGHFIKHCPMNGDRDYDIKLKPVTGIPKSMLQASSDGLYKLPNGATAIFKPNEDAFDKEMEGMSSMKHVNDLPPELFCPLCKNVMKNAVLSSKCCFNSFCDKCVREHILSKSMCYCGAKDILADDLIPNRTLRETVNAMLFEKSARISSGNGGSSITYGGSNVNVSHRPPSVALSTAFDNQEDASSCVVDSLIVKEDGWKKKEDSDTSRRSLENGSSEKLNQVLQPSSPKELMLNSDTDKINGRNKKRKNMTGPVDAGFSTCTSALVPGMYYPFPPATYNPYGSAGAIPVGFDGYSAYLSAGMRYVNYTPDFCNTAVSGIPLQSQYGVQGYSFLLENETKTRTGSNESIRSQRQFTGRCYTDEESGTARKRRKQLPLSYSNSHFNGGRGRGRGCRL